MNETLTVGDTELPSWVEAKWLEWRFRTCDFISADDPRFRGPAATETVAKMNAALWISRDELDSRAVAEDAVYETSLLLH